MKKNSEAYRKKLLDQFDPAGGIKSVKSENRKYFLSGRLLRVPENTVDAVMADFLCQTLCLQAEI
ncbi:MAG: hypothetical protein GC181_07290 [Bacteroidetes bacterium]|nr:hypothetical protein [Bacteroidota bacterium]